MSCPAKIDEGGYADIYRLSDTMVLKAFRRRTHANVTGDIYWPDHDAITRVHYRAEARAYKALQDYPELTIYIPQFFGTVNPRDKLNLSAFDQRYVDDCGLILEFISGAAVKLAYLDPKIEQKVDQIVQQIKEAAEIENPWDASCFVPGPRAEFALVDFAYCDTGVYEAALYADGKLSEDLRDKLGSAYAA